MAKYLISATYNAQGTAGVAHDGGSGRKAAVEALVSSVGGKVEALYFAFGEIDVYIIVDLPDNIAASALAMAVNRSGVVKLTTTPLLTTEEVDQAAKKSVSYRAPGG